MLRVNFLPDEPYAQYSAFSVLRPGYMNEGVLLYWNNGIVTES